MSGANGLGEKVSGDVFTRSDEGWDQARLAWNLAAEQDPAAVVYAESPDDVVAAVTYARESGLGVSGQGTGHGAVPMGPVSDVVLVKTERMNRVEIDPGAERATVGAGVVWRDLLDAAGEHGLAGLAGSSPDVGVVGYSLGGGLGWLGRRYGFACNRLSAVELVTADGELRRVDAGSEPDLFWALRGGGGSFGIVTEVEVQLVGEREVYAGSLVLPAEDGEGIFQSYREWAAGVPDEVTSIARFLHLPPIPQVPEPLRDRPLVTLGACFTGSEQEGREIVAPLRELGEPVMDLFEQMPASQLVTVHMDPEEPVPGLGHHALIEELDESAVKAFVEAAGVDSGSPLLLAELRHLGGALGRPEPDGGALSHLDAGYLMFGIGLPMSPEMAEPINRHLDHLCDVMEPWRQKGCYFNFAERPTTFEDLFPEQIGRRLTEVKAQWDPDGLIRANQAVPAAA